jgi:hypothetical protein
MSTTLTPAEIGALRDIAGAMIPANADLGMPAANDPLILDDILKSIDRNLPLVREAIETIAKKANGAFAGLDQDIKEALLNDYAGSGGAAAQALGRAVLAAYYRDDRVLVALGEEARAPFPKGHVVAPRDWSVLDPVRQRAPFWRKDR